MRRRVDAVARMWGCGMREKSRRAIRVALLALWGVGLAVPGAQAGEFDAVSLGTSAPNWVETMSRVNNDGDVAWSSRTGAFPDGAAYLYTDGPGSWPLTVSPATTSVVSAATSITERIGSGPNRHVIMVGSASSSAQLLDRRALAWKVVLGNTGPSQIYQVELNEAFGTNAMQQTAANSILATSPTTFIVVGSSRKQVSNAELPQPTYWMFQDNGATYTLTASNVHRLEVPGVKGNGVLIDVAHAANAVWACGNAASAGAYARATCWDIDQNKPGVPTPVDIFAQPNVVAALPPGVVSSVVNRVRTLPIGGTTGTDETVVVGTAMVQVGASFRWFGWTYNLTTQSFWSNFDLVNGADNMAFDVTSMAYAENGTAVYQRGMVVAGSSATVTSPQYTTPGGVKPMLFDQGPLRAMTYRQMVNVVNAEGVTCNINDEGAAVSAGTYQQTIALSPNGQFRLVQGSNTLTRLMDVAVLETPEIRIRDTYVRQTAAQRPADSPNSGPGSAPIAYNYTDVQVISSQSQGAVRLAKGLGCDSVEGALGVCAADHEAAFDIGGTGALTISLSAVGTNLLRGRHGASLTAASFDYAQFAGRAAAQQACTVTPVLEYQQLLRKEKGRYDTVAQPINPATDFDGKQWDDCYPNIPGFDTDTSISYDHCGGCLQSVNDDKWCTDDACVNSLKVNTTQSNACLIDSSCYTSAAPNPSNQCQACTPSTSQSHWTNKPNGSACTRDCYSNATCQGGACNNGVAQVDAHEPNSAASPRRIYNGGTSDFTEDNTWAQARSSSATIFPTGDEDFYHFRVYDCTTNIFGGNRQCSDGNYGGGRADNLAGDANKNPRPRFALTSSVADGNEYQVCMYLYCRDGRDSGSRPDGGSWSGTTGGDVSRVIDGRTLRGRCTLPSTSAEIHRWGYDCDSVSENSDVYITVKQMSGTASCDKPYSFSYGNGR